MWLLLHILPLLHHRGTYYADVLDMVRTGPRTEEYDLVPRWT